MATTPSSGWRRARAATARPQGRAAELLRRRRYAVRARARPKPRWRSGDIDAAVAALDLEPHDDVQATGAAKKHLAGVLLRRVADAADGSRGHEPRLAFDITLTVNGERRRRARRRAPDAGRFPARRSRSHRQPCRLRAWRLRRLHRARRRRDRARLPDAGGAMRRRQGRDHRGLSDSGESPTCRRRSSSATRCNAASARPACC